MRLRFVTAILLASVGVGGAGFADDAVTIVQILSPAPVASQTGTLTASANGLCVSWLEQVPEWHSLRFAVWAGETFGEARTIHTSGAFFAPVLLDDGWAETYGGVPLEEASHRRNGLRAIPFLLDTGSAPCGR